jgi:AraC-like DNA-binding protein
MKFSISDFSILMGGGIALLVAVGVWLRNKQQSSIANYFLIAFLLNCFISIFLKNLYFNRLFEHFPHLLKLNHPFGLLRPVTFYLYFHFLFRPQARWQKIQWLHFAPTLALLIYTLPFYALSARNKVLVFQQTLPDPAPNFLAFATLTVSLAVGYFFLSLYEWWRFRPILSQTSLPKAISTRRWLLLLLIGYALYLLSSALIWLLPYPQYEYFSYQIISLFLMVGCIKLLSQADLPAYQVVAPKYAKSNLADTQKEQLQQELLRLMRNEKLFLNENLRLKEVAQKMSLNENQLSQLVNECEGMSFNDFVNKFRIEAAQELLRSEQFYKTTIEAVGYDVGFGTRASFYNAFKKFTGQSPSEFRRKSR